MLFRSTLLPAACAICGLNSSANIPLLRVTRLLRRTGAGRRVVCVRITVVLDDRRAVRGLRGAVFLLIAILSTFFSCCYVNSPY